MREGFAPAIKKANSAAIEGASLGSFLSEVERDFGGHDAAAEIFELQKEKARIMERLRETLRQIDQEGTVGVEGKMRTVTHNGESLETFVRGRRTEITQGQLLVAGLWQEEHFLDGDVPRAFQKQYATQKAREMIAALHDKQIAHSEANQSYNRGSGRDEAYAAIAERSLEGEHISNGILAEKMIQSFFTKLTHDHDMPFTLEAATAYEDVDYKIDFFIRPKDREAVGLGVEEPQDIPEIAIQFTTDTREATIEHKSRQIETAKKRMEREKEVRARDLVLVTLPMKKVRSVFETWAKTKATKRMPGGPDELWDTATKEEVFSKILQHVLPEQERRAAWSSTQ